MNTRRGLLTTLGVGVAGFAGCLSSSQSESPDSEPTNKTDSADQKESVNESDPEEQAEDEGSEPDPGTNLDGQTPIGGAYQQALEQNPANQETLDWADNFLDGKTPEQQADALSQEVTADNYEQLLNAIYQKADDPENTIMANKGWSFTSQSEPILEIAPVQNGQLQSAPIIIDQGTIHHPGDTNPEYLAALRNDERWSRMIPTDYDAFTDRIEPLSDSEKRVAREKTFSKMSCAFPGLGPEDNVIPYDGENANLAADFVQEQDAEQASEYVTAVPEGVTDLDAYGEDDGTWISAEYTEDGVKFRTHTDWEPGMYLPGEQ